MTSDLISRKALLQLLYEKWLNNIPNRTCFFLDGEIQRTAEAETIEKIMKEIEGMPTVDRWIPCSERLPEDESVPYWTTHEDGSIVMHWYSKECGFTFNWEVKDLEKRKRQGRVIAWMPILQPEPYKAGDIDG